MQTIDRIHRYYSRILGDSRVNVWHISLYTAIVLLWLGDNARQPVKVTRKVLMDSAHIKSMATYHKCMAELQQYGYLDYQPSYDYHVGSRVRLI